MKKRIFAAIIAVIMLLSVFALASCENDAQPNEESKKELTAKELFTASFANTFAIGEGTDFSGILNANKNSKDSTTSFELKVDKLEAMGSDLASLGNIALNGNINTDADSNSSEMDFKLSFFGDEPTASILFDNTTQQIFIKDLFGTNEKPILYQATENLNDVIDFEVSKIDETVITHIITSATVILNKNFGDDAFVMETKDVKVDGKDFQGAKVITLTITDEKANTIVSELFDLLLTNETINEYFEAIGKEFEALGEEFNKEELLKELEFPKSVKIINTVVDEKSIALDILIELNAEKDEESDDEERGYVNFAIHANYIDGNFKLDLGPIDSEGKYIDEEGFITVAYTLENENEKFIIALTEDGETIEAIKLEGTKKDNKREGTLTIGNDSESNASIKYSIDLAKDKGSIKLYDLSITDDGIKTEVNLTLTAEYVSTETKFEANGVIKFGVEGEFDLSASYKITMEAKDVTIEKITDYIDPDDFDFDFDSLDKKFPAISAILGSFGGIQGGAEEDETYYRVSDSFSIWLPTDFVQVEESPLYNAMFIDEENERGIYILEEGFSTLDSDIKTTEEYLEHVISRDLSSHLSLLVKGINNDLPYVIFKDIEGSGTIHYFSATSNEESFWLMHFICNEDGYPDCVEDFHEWAWYADPYADKMTAW